MTNTESLVRFEMKELLNDAIKKRKRKEKYLFIKIQCSFKVFEARVDHAAIVVVT